MNISKTAVNRPVATFMCVLIAIAFGALSISRLKMDLYPNMNIPIACVMTTYTGVGSEEIEKLITEPIESSMGTVSGIDTISSNTSNGSSFVIVQFEDDVDIDMAAVDMREKIDLIKRTLPEDADDPMVIKIDINSMTGIQISAVSESMDISELKTFIENDVSDRLERQNGVASVTVMGGNDREVRVVLKEDKLRGYGISESSLAGILSAENSNTPLGSIEHGTKNLTLRVRGEFESIEDIKNIPISTNNGGTIFLNDIADVSMVYKDSASMAYTNGKSSINMFVQKQSTANTVNVSKVVLKELEKLKAENPNIEFKVINDPAEMINDSLQSVADSAIQGGILAVIILYIFLRNFRSTVVVGSAMPISIIATFALMYFSGITLNLMSLGGLTMGIGMLVDNSIVVLESIYKKIEEGHDRITSAIEGAREVGASVIASTLTTVAVFLPIPFFGGTMGKMFNDLSLTIVFSLMSSLIVAITFVPMASSVLLSPDAAANVHKKRNIFTIFLDVIGHGISIIEVIYKKILGKALKYRKITVLITFAFVVFTGMVIPSMGFEFMPSSDEGIVKISIEMPTGTKVEETEKVAWTVVDRMGEVPGLVDMAVEIGGGSGASSLTGGAEDTANITLNLVDKEERDFSSDELAIQIRKKIKDIPGAKITAAASSDSMGSYGSSGAEVVIKGDDTETLRDISNDFVNLIKKIPETSDVKTSIEDAAPQTTIKINRSKASSYGISSSSVASLIRTAVTGSVASTYRIGGDEYDIRIMHDNSKINYVNDVENILIPTNLGTNIPLYEIADIVTDDIPVTITRKNQEKYVTVSCNIENIDIGTMNAKITETLSSYIMPQGYTYEMGGTTEDMQEAFSGLGQALILAIVLVYMIMAAEFEAFSYPLLIMGSIPIAATGGLFGLFIYGEAISITSFLGLIMLAGVVINNAIVLVDYSNLLRRERGLEFLQAMKIVGPTRLRPILMSTLTTVLGLLPMMISTATGSETMRGLATVVVFGLMLSTLVTLIFVPVIYCMYCGGVEKRKAKRERKRKLKADINTSR